MADAKFTAGGFGGRTFRADAGIIWAEPRVTHNEDGSSSYSLGFKFAELAEHIDPPCDGPLAEYLSCPKRAAAPDLYEALWACHMRLQTARDIGNAADDAALAKGAAALAKARGEQVSA